MKTKIISLIFLFGILNPAFGGPREKVVQITARIERNPPKIILEWPPIPGAQEYQINYRGKDESLLRTWGRTTGTRIEDTNVSIGTGKEYIVSVVGNNAIKGFIWAGIDLPLVENRGGLILLVEESVASPLSEELKRLEYDLTGDGWNVIRRDVSRSDSVLSVKSTIQGIYNSEPNVKALFLFGNIPVPYAGNGAYDGHAEHRGAWPADIYYADVEEENLTNPYWTDHLQNTTSANRSENWNIPGDGKFDQGNIQTARAIPSSKRPISIELQVGRVDLSRMPAFAPKTEIDLLRQYLDKDHSFRHKKLTFENRGLVDNNWPTLDHAINGYGNFSAFFGPENIVDGDLIPLSGGESFLWGWAGGWGGYQSASGVGNTQGFATHQPKVAFNMLFGSYFGDWDNTDNFLRAPLATKYGLTSSWSGFLNWYYHHMALGDPIGYSAWVVNNDTQPSLYRAENTNSARGSVAAALMGDPTLRLQAVSPPQNATLLRNVDNQTVTLNWDASEESVAGYHIYQSETELGPFTRANDTIITDTSWTGPTPPNAKMFYMVRAIKLEEGRSGSYFNPSQGVWATEAPSEPPVLNMGSELEFEDTFGDGKIDDADLEEFVAWYPVDVDPYGRNWAFDFNRDRKLDTLDLDFLFNTWDLDETSPEFRAEADLNGLGVETIELDAAQFLTSPMDPGLNFKWTFNERELEGQIISIEIPTGINLINLSVTNPQGDKAQGDVVATLASPNVAGISDRARRRRGAIIWAGAPQATRTTPEPLIDAGGNQTLTLPSDSEEKPSITTHLHGIANVSQTTSEKKYPQFWLLMSCQTGPCKSVKINEPLNSETDATFTAQGIFRLGFVAFTADRLLLDTINITVQEPTIISPPTPDPIQQDSQIISKNVFNPTAGEAGTIQTIQSEDQFVSVRVFNSRGTLIQSKSGIHMIAGPNRWDWDGRNDAGQTVASGVYHILLEGSDSIQKFKMVIIK